MGQKKYEITNHLGNVLAVVTDKKEDIENTNGPDKFQEPTLYAAYDYYPFGMLMPDRYIENSFDQCAYVTKNIYRKVRISPWQLSTTTLNDASLFSPMGVTNIDFIPTNEEGEPGVVNITAEPDNAAGVEVSIGNMATTANKEVEVELSVVNLGDNIVTVTLEQYNPASGENEAILPQAYTLEPGREERFTVSATTINTEPLNAVLTSEGEGINAIAVNTIAYTYLDELVESKLVKICNTGEFDDDYRFGFNGMEKDNEVNGIGNSLDFGARIYDSRLGRWLSLDPLANKYPDMSAYVGIGNDPINLTDPDGRVLRDLKGNIIVTFDPNDSDTYLSGTTTEKTNADGTVTVTRIGVRYRKGFIYTNDGNQVEVSIAMSGVTQSWTWSKDGKTVLKTTSKEGIDRKKSDDVSDCHGLTFADDILWIDNTALNNDKTVEQILEDEYTATTKSKADIVVFKAAKDGDGGEKKGGIIHSAKVNKNGTFTSNAGSFTTKRNLSLKGAAGEAFGKKKKTMTDISQPGTVNYYKHEGDKIVNLSGGSQAGAMQGLKTYSKDAVDKAIRK